MEHACFDTSDALTRVSQDSGILARLQSLHGRWKTTPYPSRLFSCPTCNCRRSKREIPSVVFSARGGCQISGRPLASVSFDRRKTPPNVQQSARKAPCCRCHLCRPSEYSVGLVASLRIPFRSCLGCSHKCGRARESITPKPQSDDDCNQASSTIGKHQVPTRSAARRS